MTERIVIAALIIAGFVFTATNGVLAYRSARDRLSRFGRVVQQVKGTDHRTVDPDAADRESDRVLHALQASRTSLILAGVGLLVSTVASVWAVFL